MYRDITTFFREMPLTHYLAGGFLSTKEPTLAFFCGREQIQALAAGVRGGVGYETSLAPIFHRFEQKSSEAF
jgi:hypothetical protein